MLARPGRAGWRYTPPLAPKWAIGTSPDAHFGALRKRHRYPALPGRANPGRPVGPKTLAIGYSGSRDGLANPYVL